MSKTKHIQVNVIEQDGKLRATLGAGKVVARGLTSSSAAPKATKAPENNTSSTLWTDWGDDNAFPQNVRRKLDQTTVAKPIIGRLCGMMYGNGIYYYKKRYEDNLEVREKQYIPEIEEFLEVSNTPGVLMGLIADYRYYMNCFGTLIFTNDKKRVARITHRYADFCRLGIQNPKTRVVSNCYYSANFPNPTEDEYDVFPLLNEDNPQSTIDALTNTREVMMHAKYRMPGNLFYAMPWWSGLFVKDGWLDVALTIPQVLNKMQRNQIILKYIIKIPITYFRNRYRDWETYTQKEQLKVIDKKVEEMNDALSGTDNVYKSITDIYGVDAMGNVEAGIEIVPVDDKTKKDSWVPSSDAADKQTAYALGLHPSQMGIHDGGKIGEGSGSNQREAFNSIVDINTVEQEVVLSIFNMASRINGWGVKFAFEHTRHVTLDKSKTAKEDDDE